MWSEDGIRMINKYRKKPVVIEAMQFTQDTYKDVREWLGDYLGAVGFKGDSILDLTISTLEGHITAQIGDYIIKGIKGEFYPCKPDIFEETYEKVQDK